MVSWLKRFAVPVAAVALFAAMPRAASADTVTTSSTGSFAAAGTDIASGSSLTTSTGNTALSYAGTGDFSADLTKVVTLGSFTLTTSLDTSSGGETFNALDQFTVNISQVINPGSIAGGNSSTGNLVAVGTIHAGSGGDLVINFNPNPVSIDGKSYLLLNATISGPTGVGASGSGTGLLQAALTNPTAAVPLPSTRGWASASSAVWAAPVPSSRSVGAATY